MAKNVDRVIKLEVRRFRCSHNSEYSRVKSGLYLSFYFHRITVSIHPEPVSKQKRLFNLSASLGFWYKRNPFQGSLGPYSGNISRTKK